MADNPSPTDKQLILAALMEARDGIASGGMPFGSVLVIDGKIVSKGHNRQIQDGKFLAHAEMMCLESFLTSHDGQLKNSTLVATEAPCPMCAGAALVAGVSRIVIGETHHYRGAYDWLCMQDVEVVVLDNSDCIDLVSEFRSAHPDRWNRFSAG